MANLDPDNLQKLRVVDLKEILNQRNLSTSGLKADLVKRLRSALISEKSEEEADDRSFAEDDDVSYGYGEHETSFPQYDEQHVKAEQEKLEAKMKLEEAEKNLAEENKRRMLEEENQRRLEEEKQRMLEEENQKKKEEQKRLEEQRFLEQQRILEEEEEKKRQQRIAYELEMQRLREEEEMRKQVEFEEKKKILLAEEQQKLLAEEKQRLLAEEQKRLFAEEQKRLLAEEQQRRLLAEEQQRLLAEEQQRLLAEEQQRLLAEEQQRLLAEEQQRLLVEEQQRLLAEEQHRLLAEEQQRLLVEEQQILFIEEQKRLAEEQQKKFLGEQQQKMLAEQQLITENEKVKEKEMLQQNTLSNSATEFIELHIPSTIVAPGTLTTNTPLTKDLNIDQNDEIKLPSAVEKILALKSERAQELGVDPDSVVEPPMESSVAESTVRKPISRALVSVEEMDDDDMEEQVKVKDKESKSRRRKKKKNRKKHSAKINDSKENIKRRGTSKYKSNDIDIEYVQDVLDVTEPMYAHFINIFEIFKLTDPDKDSENASMEEAKHETKIIDRKKPRDLDDDDDDDDDDEKDKKEEEKPKLSKRKLKKLSRMTVAELKQKVSRPELVEMHDVTAKDPVLLLHLKASRNTVPVPRHWCFKRKYLQGKRGIEKPAFELPDFIKRTGIMEMRQALQEKEDQKTMKAKMRERVRPKLGKIDIDYQKLHDAFFKWQTKPKMTIHGDLYYEGKEFETRLKEKKPGDLNDDLRIALGMPTGPNANKCPPPWLIAMQRYGPPPSYPNLKIPGLNAPIPDTCSFGYHAGGWGKPPVDEMGRPLYGDVFGTQNADNLPHLPEEEIDHTLWGELESESSEEEEDEDEEEEEEEEQKGEDETGLVTPAEGLITPSGFSSIPAGMETPDMIELRKRKIEAEMEGGETPALYTILPEKKTERVGAAMMGSTHIYDLAAAIPAAAKAKVPGTTSVAPQGIEVALDPSELEMDSAAMAARYEQTMREQQNQLAKEDLSDMVAEHAARQKTKRKKQQQDSGKAPKKYKEFKF